MGLLARDPYASWKQTCMTEALQFQSYLLYCSVLLRTGTPDKNYGCFNDNTSRGERGRHRMGITAKREDLSLRKERSYTYGHSAETKDYEKLNRRRNTEVDPKTALHGAGSRIPGVVVSFFSFFFVAPFPGTV